MTQRPSTRARRLRHRVLRQLDDFLALARDDPGALALRVPEISAWSVAEQLEHVALADRSILDGLDRLARGEAASSADNRPGDRKPSWPARLLLVLGWIPRGRGEAPRFAQPRGLDAEALAAALARVRERFARLDLARLESAGGTFPHFFFGSLAAVGWLRFAGVHHHHHRKIIRDIRRSPTA